VAKMGGKFAMTKSVRVLSVYVHTVLSIKSIRGIGVDV
jgi:hypothetical protein